MLVSIRPIGIAEIRETCCGCPSQWSGRTTEGESVYIRFRWGHLSVSINDAEPVYEWDSDDQYAGIMSYDELKPHLALAGFCAIPEFAPYGEDA